MCVCACERVHVCPSEAISVSVIPFVSMCLCALEVICGYVCVCVHICESVFITTRACVGDAVVSVCVFV